MAFQRSYAKREPGWRSRRALLADADDELVDKTTFARQLREVWPNVRGITAKAVNDWLTPAERHHHATPRGVVLAPYFTPIRREDVEEYEYEYTRGHFWSGRLGEIALKLHQYAGVIFP